MVQNKYKLSFYESGYIKPEDFESEKFELRDWSADTKDIIKFYREGFISKEQLKNIKFYGCIGVDESED